MINQILKYFTIVSLVLILIMGALGFYFQEQLFYDVAIYLLFIFFIVRFISFIVIGVKSAKKGNWQWLIFLLLFIAFGVFAYFKSIN